MFFLNDVHFGLKNAFVWTFILKDAIKVEQSESGIKCFFVRLWQYIAHIYMTADIAVLCSIHNKFITNWNGKCKPWFRFRFACGPFWASGQFVVSVASDAFGAAVFLHAFHFRIEGDSGRQGHQRLHLSQIFMINIITTNLIYVCPNIFLIIIQSDYKASFKG